MKAAIYCKITSKNEYDALNLTAGKSLIWRELEQVLPNIGSSYTAIELELGPRKGLRHFCTYASQWIELHTDASCSSKGNKWMSIAFRQYADRQEEIIWRAIEPIRDTGIDYATPCEAFAVCQGLKWVHSQIEQKAISDNEPIELYVDNTAIYYKLKKYLTRGKYSNLYEQMIDLPRPLTESGRLQIFGSTHFTNRAEWG